MLLKQNSVLQYFWAVVLISLVSLSNGFANQQSADISLLLDSPADDENWFTGQGVVMVLPGLPANADLIAWHLRPGDIALFALDTAVDLPGAIRAFVGDVIAFDGVDYSIVWRASDEGLPDGVMTDAISEVDGDLALSFDVAVQLNGVVVEDEDLVRFTGGGPVTVFDGTALRVDASHDVDAATWLDRDGGRWFVSFDTSGEVDGLRFNDEDVLVYNVTTDQWEFFVSGGIVSSMADLDALHAIVALMKDGFE